MSDCVTTFVDRQKSTNNISNFQSEDLFRFCNEIMHSATSSEKLIRNTTSVLDVYLELYMSTLMQIQDGVHCCNSDIVPQNLENYSNGIVYTPVEESTDNCDINKINDEFQNKLRQKTQSFLRMLLKMDFEDGITNEAVEDVKYYISKNKAATILWLYELYSQNMKRADIISGLLRVISATISVDDCCKLIPIVKCGLSDNNPSVQESAIMVIEEWRTKECLDALRTTTYYSGWIKSYANKVAEEIEKELGL